MKFQIDVLWLGLLLITVLFILASYVATRDMKECEKKGGVIVESYRYFNCWKDGNYINFR